VAQAQAENHPGQRLGRVEGKRQSPERAYDIALFDEFARAAAWTERLSLENPEFRPPS